MKEKMEAVLGSIENLFDSKYPGKSELKLRALGLYREAMDRETSPSFGEQVLMYGQTQALRDLMTKHQDIYSQIKNLKP